MVLFSFVCCLNIEVFNIILMHRFHPVCGIVFGYV